MLLLIQNGCNCDGLGSWFWWLIGAFILGAILGWLLRCILGNCQEEKTTVANDNSSQWESKYNACIKDKAKLQADLDACNKAKIAASAVAATSTVAAIAPAFVKPEDRDNLKKVEGIGPKIEQLLFDDGIYTWKALSETAVSRIQGVLDKAGPRYRVHNPASWPLQAKMAHEGKWDELNKWQDEHKGGLL